MKVLTAKQAKKKDSIAIEKYIPGILLMENAAIKSICEIQKRYEELSSKSILVVCGPGNNGGDGFSIARGLINSSKDIRILFIGDKDALPDDAKKNFDICNKLEIPFVEDIDINYDIIIDGIFGIGLDRDIEGKYYDIIEKMNKNKGDIVSLDIASGVSADTGNIYNIAVRADLTITFDRPKLGHFLYPGKNYNRELKIVDIGIPRCIDEEINNTQKREFITKKDIKLKEIDDLRHKGEAGKVLILGGNPGFTGAAYMAGISCLNMGAGLVTLAIPKSLNSIFELKTDEIMTYPLEETEERTISDKSYVDIITFIEKKDIDTILIGPGLGRNPETMNLVRRLIENIENRKLVLDADALYAIKDNLEVIDNKDIILTPHMGEFKRFFEEDAKIDNLVYESEKFAWDHKVTLALKGPSTIISDNERTYINSFANGGMSVGGMGDVLSGMIASLLSQGYPLVEAAKLGVYLHSYIGKEILNEISKESLTPMKIVKNIGKYLKKIRDVNKYEL